MQFVLLTQHYDTIKEVGEKNSSIIVPYSPGNLQNLQQQLMEGNLMADEINRLSKDRTKIPTVKKTFAQKEKDILDINKSLD